ncbi:ribonuclease P protein component [Caldinitratiruptor microaerophilus]|uniref:Ribonuclease P protein component n=1 Tax=Caldinitratiruptor microaerophilus TaxID=671077 RepID=A0AA35CQB2_9FIRM|nr:ribonuclease P protein component [Caldinitratiruptor microaerophilus]BDG61870.1 ribonuclease P protein component [Caldinitratiruptor microaerophilus]
MKRCFRLRTRREFEEVYRRGRSWANQAAVVYSVRLGEGAARLGVAAGRKLGSAVVRNRVKRRLREAARRLWPEVRPGYVLVLIGRAGARDMPFSELCSAVRELFRRAGVLKGAAAGRGGSRPDERRE